jgi:putative membrane protein
MASAAPAPAEDFNLVRRLGLGELMLAGLTSNHLVSAFALIGALWALADDFILESIYERFARSAYGATRLILKQDVWTTVIVTALGLLSILLLAILFSVVGTVALYYGFTLTRRGESIGRRYGLLTRRASSLPRQRIQLLEIEEGLLRRSFRLATLRADTVGGHAEGDDEKDRGRSALLPVVPRDEVEGLLPVFFPDLEPGPPDWRRVSRLAIRRGTVKGAVICALAAVALAFFQGSPLGLWPLLGLPLIYWISVRRYLHLGYALGTRYFRTRRGWLSRSTHIVPIRKAQAIEIHQGPFDRRLGLATLIVDTAGLTYTGGGPRISNLPLAEARQLARALAQQAAVTK